MKVVLLASFAALVATPPLFAGSVSVNQPAPTYSPASAFSNTTIQVTVTGGDQADITGGTTITPPSNNQASIGFSGNYSVNAGEEGSIAYYFVADLNFSGTVTYTGSVTISPLGTFAVNGTITSGLHIYSGQTKTAKFPISASGTYSAQVALQFNPGSGVMNNVGGGSAAAPGTLRLYFDQFALQVATTDVQIVKASQPLNISTRLAVQTGDNVLIGGFILTGADQKQVLIRGLGPSLPVPNPLADPTLELHSSSGTIATNDNWKVDDSTGQSQQAAIESTSIPPSNDLESAILQTLPANNNGYTAILRGKNGGTGIGLVEVYDLAQAANSQLANISTRGFVDTGDNVMIGGFILGPNTNASTKVVVRAIGPSLTAAGVANALQDPTLELHDVQGNVIASNDNWQTDPNQSQVSAAGVAPSDPRESALFAIPQPGNYTAVMRGANNTTGVGLVEVYHLP